MQVSLGKKTLRNTLIVYCFTYHSVLTWSVYNFPHQTLWVLAGLARYGSWPIKYIPILIGIGSCLEFVLLTRVSESSYIINIGNNTESWDARVMELKSTQMHSAVSIKPGHNSGSLQSLRSVRLCSEKHFIRAYLTNAIQCALQSLCSWADWDLKKLMDTLKVPPWISVGLRTQTPVSGFPEQGFLKHTRFWERPVFVSFCFV